jgi:hypothetical protein
MPRADPLSELRKRAQLRNQRTFFIKKYGSFLLKKKETREIFFIKKKRNQRDFFIKKKSESFLHQKIRKLSSLKKQGAFRKKRRKTGNFIKKKRKKK